MQSQLTPAAPSPEYFELVVWLPGRGPLRDLFRAGNIREAVELAERTYPGCAVEIPPAAQGKPRLARSATSPSVLKSSRYVRIRAARSKKV